MKYTGELGRHTDAWLRAAFAMGVVKGNPTPKAREQEAIALRELQRLTTLLFEHYGVDPDADDGWQTLAICLARDHVPAFQFQRPRPSGRPRKKLAGLNYLAQMHPAPKKRGRPADPDRPKWLRSLLWRVVKVCQEKGFSNATQAIDYELKDYAKSEGRSYHTVMRQNRNRWQKDLSEAKKLFPEIAAKLPR